MRLRFIIFLLLMTLTLMCSGAYVGLRVLSVWSDVNHTMVWVAITGIIFLQMLGPFLYRALPTQERRFFALRWSVFTFMGIGATMILFTLLADLTLTVLRFFARDLALAAEPYGIGFALSLVLVSNVIGVIQMSTGPFIKRVSVKIPDQFADLRGMTIVQISDLHIGPSISRKFAQKVVTLTNSLNPDLIALTGDLIDGYPDILRNSVSPLADLKARLGVFAVFGNHEFYWDARKWDSLYRELGFTTLHSACARIAKGGAHISVIGVPDRESYKIARDFHYDVPGACAGAAHGDFKLLLAHQPRSAREAAESGAHLVLSGHTHGGQFFPFTILVKIAEPFIAGLYKVGSTWLYVNRGTGYWGPPTRFLVPPEITLLTLD